MSTRRRSGYPTGRMVGWISRRARILERAFGISRKRAVVEAYVDYACLVAKPLPPLMAHWGRHG